MDPLIVNLKSTTFFGERLSRRQIAEIQETVGRFPLLSRTELGHTLCVHFGWQTPRGSNRLQFALRLLEELERLSILTRPARQGAGRGPQKPLELTARTAPQPALAGPLAALRPVRLELVSGSAQVSEWNEWVERYHPLGYRQPVGAHLRYFVRDRAGRVLGCLLFDFASSRLACRDAWIGWQEPARQKRLKLVVRNARYLLLPWVRVEHLASHVLGLAARQLAGDWMNLVERFFADLTQDCVRDGSFASVRELKNSIVAYLEERNQAPKPYRWKARGAEILAKIQRARQALEQSGS